MLDVARGKAASAGLSNVEYRVGDAEALVFGDASFDAVICASSIMVLRDILKALHEWHRVLKVGGTIAFSTFGARYLQPVLKILGERLYRYDGQPPPVPFFLNSTDTPDKCRELLKRAGFEEIEVTTEQLGVYPPDLTVYWQEISLTFVGMRLSRLNPVDLERFKTEHLSEMESMRTDRGLLIELPTLFSVARKWS
jgi:SAM-dependent methyltransferase